MPVWLEASEVAFFHRELIIEHGGLPGVRDMGALEAALMAAAAEEFGDVVLEDDSRAAPQETEVGPRVGHVPVSAHVVFLFALFAGGLLAALSVGDWTIGQSLGADFVRLAGDGWQVPMILLGGGVNGGVYGPEMTDSDIADPNWLLHGVDFRFYALPIKARGAAAMPVRAFAELDA